ncbi:hypothetical protein TrVGV298_010649 [Trichoderma virens]|nr:hypothetical protein TrVGV298_010649 [Trichoderma virens]
MATNDNTRPKLLSAVLDSHGGERRFNEINSIKVTFNLSGLLFDDKGCPSHLQPTITINPHAPKASFTGLGNVADERWEFLPNKTWIERRDGSVRLSRENPRVACANAQDSKWDDLHMLYFTGYAMWNYLTAPFSFTLPGVTTRELKDHAENGETWRVLEVTYPDDFPTHNKIQQFYYDEQFMVRRLDYAPDVLGGPSASQYMFDYKTSGGLTFPTLRRVVPRAASGVFGPRLVLMDLTEITVS